MKATLTFDLDSPEGRERFDAAIEGEALRDAVRDFDNEIRSWLKYNAERFDSVDDALNAVRAELRDKLDERLEHSVLA